MVKTAQLFIDKSNTSLSKRQQQEILKSVKKKLEKQKKIDENKRKEHNKSVRKTFKGGTKKILRVDEGRKKIKKRETAIKGFLGAVGIVPESRYSGPGRPRGSFKYGVPIHIYKKIQRDKRIQYQRYKQEQAMRLGSRGFTPQQVQQLQQQQTIRQIQAPVNEDYDDYEEMQEEYEYPSQRDQIQPQQMPMRRKSPYGRILPRSSQVQPQRSIADEEVDFRQWSAEQTISPRSQRIFDTIRRIQNKAKRDNIEEQRRHRERAIAARMMNLLKAHENKINVDMDFTGVSEDNPLLAHNVFRENPGNNIMRTNRRNILDMGENNLRFF